MSSNNNTISEIPSNNLWSGMGRFLLNFFFLSCILIIFSIGLNVIIASIFGVTSNNEASIVNQAEFILIIYSIVLAIVTMLISLVYIRHKKDKSEWWSSFYQNISNTFLLSALASFIAVFTLDAVNSKQVNITACQTLLNEISSLNIGVADNALEELRATHLLLADELDETPNTLANCEERDHYLRGENFEDVHLTRGNLSNLALDRTLFQFSQLDYANFSGSSLAYAYFRDADLTRAQFVATDMNHAIFTNAIMIGADLRDSTLTAALFRGANLSGGNLSGINQDEREALSEDSLSKLNFDRATFIDVTANEADFSHATFIDVNFENAELRASNFTYAIFTDAVFQNADIDGSVFENADLRGVDFSEARFDLVFINNETMLEGAILADGVAYDENMDTSVLLTYGFLVNE